jgi:hypothetical protein
MKDGDRVASDGRAIDRSDQATAPAPTFSPKLEKN